MFKTEANLLDLKKEKRIFTGFVRPSDIWQLIVFRHSANMINAL
ncbi:hypothetical protein AT05_02070 [Schleiferia thermophila str. Yellowstone]|nr:hypothetical protein AT05_02070 [Schleiferia thermophila str. Yellowstone]